MSAETAPPTATTAAAPGAHPRRRGRRGPKPGTPRAPRLPRAEREAQLLVIAEEVFGERGYQFTTMEEVAERAGVTKPVIYDYFGSKEGLLAACIARARTELQTATIEVWRTMPRTSTTEQYFRTSVRAFFGFIDEHASAFSLIQQEGILNVTALNEVETIRAEQAAAVAGTLAEIVDFGDVPPTLVEGVAEVIIGTCERVAVWRLRRPEITADLATELVMSTVWRGLESAVRTLPSGDLAEQLPG